MKEISRIGNCEKGEDLIAFLYGELDTGESRTFEQHMQMCEGCRAEYATFAELRESIVTWRNESLSTALAPAVNGTIVAPAAFQSKEQHKSAVGAIRGFFDLSPLWMKGATAFASLLFCVCAVLAIAYVKGPRSSVVATNDKVYSEKEFASRIAQEKEKMLAELPKATEAKNAVAVQTKIVHRQVAPHSASAANVFNPRRPLSPQERNELATDLRLVSSKDDDDLDLIGDSNRQTP